jgi:hypothetical protein
VLSQTVKKSIFKFRHVCLSVRMQGFCSHWTEQVLVHLSTVRYGLTVLKCKAVPYQYLFQWNNTPNHTNLWLYAAVVLLMMGANSTRNMYRANDERNKEYSVYLVGHELNIYVTKMYGNTNITCISLCLHLLLIYQSPCCFVFSIYCQY